MGRECELSWMISFWIWWKSIIIQICAFFVQFPMTKLQLNGNILPLSDVIAFTHVEKASMCTSKQVSLLRGLLVCFFSVARRFFLLLGAFFRKNQNNIGCRWKKTREKISTEKLERCGTEKKEQDPFCCRNDLEYKHF